MSHGRWRWFLVVLLVSAAAVAILSSDPSRLGCRARALEDEPTAAERRFADAVTRWVVELNRGTRATESERRQLTSGVIDAFDDLVESAAGRSQATLRSELAKLLAELESSPTRDASQRLSSRVNGVNRSLRERDVPILLWGSALPSPNRAILHVYRVKSKIELETPSGTVDAAVVSRLDRLNVSLGLIGFQVHGDAGALPVVLAEQTRLHVVDVILPTLASRSLPLGDGCSDAYRDRIGTTAGGAIAAQLEGRIRRSLGRRALERLHDLAEHVAERREIWERWRRRYAPSLVFSRIDYVLPPDAGVDLPLVPRHERRRFEDAQAAISDMTDADHVAAPLLDWVAARVARHEAQHYLDQIDPPDLAPASSLASWLPAPGRASRPGAPLDPVIAELSAYLAEIASDSELPSLTWATLANAVGDPGASSGTARVAALLLLETLGTARDAPAATRRAIDPARTAATLAAFVAAPAGQQARRAREAYEDVFGRPPPAVTLREVR